jgi:ABC-type lipoprotein export system ATPase subunit
MTLLREAHRQGTTLLMVTHNASLTSAAQRVLALDGGVVTEGGRA